ncbi:conserved hypothetical protein [Flexibacter flexilis DSM 6793]|uniref:Glycosyl transferase n=1 Tax=Flexibacter flexilis DSM 6793 TaxID=927664 RepID=A0A1I1JKD5_9BACT|nr:glycosyltransferase family protein [Flexibacter flexilis]SFC48956.1 conserved hypothetical protein [Flexibacter flexilis DSM 6793]
MKIFYAVQATGNGHLSRASQLYPFLKKYGDVDFFVSGCNSNIDYAFPVKYKSRGWSLHYSKTGGLDYWDIFKHTSPRQMYKDAAALPLKQYDVVINDFDFITSLACQTQGVSSVQFGHQASFQSKHTPRPDSTNLLGEMILQNFARANQYIGLHFEQYDKFIFPPIVKQEFIQADITDEGHVTVYLPAFMREKLLANFSQLPHIRFHWFLPEIKQPFTEKNISYYPVNQQLFNESLRTCKGIITGAGFETPSEALYMNKKVLAVPIQKHYEQECNAAAMQRMGVCVVKKIDDLFAHKIAKWYASPQTQTSVAANNIAETLAYLFDTYPYAKTRRPMA